MEVEIGKKKYKLNKVSIYITYLWADYVRLYNESLTSDALFEELRLDADIKLKEAQLVKAEAETIEDKLKARKAILKADIELAKSGLEVTRGAREIKHQAYETSRLAKEKHLELLREVVELNGHKWDEEIWLKKFSSEDFQKYVDEYITGKKKDR